MAALCLLPAVSSAKELTTALRDAQGKAVGEATLRDTPNGVLIRVALHDLPPGQHGFHVGACEPPFESAGEHLARAGSSHGFRVEAGPHAGDLPNLVVPSSGRVDEEVFAANLRLDQIQDQDGAALVVHAKPDDHQSQPSGDAGDRIACGVIGSAG
jgi:Cu-Zn family superoxide dismutase